MLLYRTRSGPVLHSEGRYYLIDSDWESLVNDEHLYDRLSSAATDAAPGDALADATKTSLAPLGERQEVWAAGVTYFRSKTARMEEAEGAGGGDFYDRVYAAERPEIFFKATPHRTVGPGGSLHLRNDSKWIVPEPELVLVITRGGTIVGYTIGNDLSCRDIEGENPLYLPQAKTFDRCAAVGPAVAVFSEPIAPETAVELVVRRGSQPVVEGGTTLLQMKRKHEQLVDFLFRDNPHPHGVLMMTGTGIVPPDDFSLQPGDIVDISIQGIGTLRNPVE